MENDRRMRFFKERIKPVGKCWEWIGTYNSKSKKPIVWYDGKTMSAKRLSYLIFTGEVPGGRLVMGNCGNMKCVHPDHVEAVTPRGRNLLLYDLNTGIGGGGARFWNRTKHRYGYNPDKHIEPSSLKKLVESGVPLELAAKKMGVKLI